MNAIEKFAREHGAEYNPDLETKFKDAVQSVIGNKGKVVDAWSYNNSVPGDDYHTSSGYIDWWSEIRGMDGMTPNTYIVICLSTDLEFMSQWLTCFYRDENGNDLTTDYSGDVGKFDPFPLIDKCLKQAGKSESKKPESCKDGKKESMEHCDACGAVMTEYDYDRYGGLCKRCRDKGEAKKPAESSKKSESDIWDEGNELADQIRVRFETDWGSIVGDHDVEIDQVTNADGIVEVVVYFDGNRIGRVKGNNDIGWDFIPSRDDRSIHFDSFDKLMSAIVDEFYLYGLDHSESESKKSEGIGDRIKMGIDYNMFMRMCRTAAYLDEDEDYWDALWEYYSEMGEIEDALVFFDNLFQYTAWCDADELYDEYLDDKFKDDSKSKEECIEAAIDDGDLQAYKHEKGNYLVIF